MTNKRVKSIPEILTDTGTKKRYRRGLFLGKGGFARCYELVDLETNVVYAGKIVAKSQLIKPHHKDKMVQEIAIHRSLKHKHVVRFHGYFEDSDFVYIILELCRRRSLMEMIKRRRTLIEPEARYFVHQIALACKYLHSEKIIHRDLKLGNLFLSDTIEIKLGDFGLATKLEFDGERKKTLCGTPNYIAPEVIGKEGHSFEVDSWSLGCILFTLLVGRPPFETATLNDTYRRIKKNDYHIPTYISNSASSLIRKLLHSNPGSRPSMDQILDSDFMKDGYLPSELPVSCLTVPPRFSNTTSHLTFSTFNNISTRKPLAEVNKGNTDFITVATKSMTQSALPTVPEGEVLKCAKPEKSNTDIPKELYLSNLYKMLLSVIASKPKEKVNAQPEEAEDPAAIPVFWVSRWVDYTEKYGLGYQLCDNSIGVVFNDATHIILQADGQTVQYIDREEAEEFHTLQEPPERLNKKFTLLKHFQTYMNEHLQKTGENVARESNKLSRLPYLSSWFRTKNAIVLHLTSGTVQINFFKDHTKIILCPLMEAVTYINEKREFITYRMKLIEKHGCSNELLSRLDYARSVVEKLLISKPTHTQK